MSGQLRLPADITTCTLFRAASPSPLGGRGRRLGSGSVTSRLQVDTSPEDSTQDRNSGVYLNRPPDAAPGDSRRKHAAGVIFRTPHSALASTQKCSCPTPHCTLQVLDLISESLFVAPPVSSPWAPRCAALGRAVRWFCDDVTDVIRHVGCIERSLATLAERHTRYMVPESRTMMV